MTEPAADAAKPAEAPAAEKPAPPPTADPAAAHVAGEWVHDRPMISCRFDPSGKFVFGTSEDRTIQRWEIATGKKVSFAATHDSWVRGLAFSKDGQTLISGGYDGRLIWWPAAEDAPTPQRTIDAHHGWIRSLAVSPDGALLASGGNDNLVRLWNVADGAKVAEITGADCHIYSVAFHPDGKRLFAGDLRGNVCEYDVAGGAAAGGAKPLRTFDAKALHSYNGGQGVDFGGIRDITLSPDGKHILCSGLYKAENPLGAISEPLVLAFEDASAKLVQSMTSGVKGSAWRAIMHPGGFVIGGSGGSGGGWIIFWKLDKPAEFHKVQTPNLIRDMDLHPDNLQIVTSHHDHRLRLTKLFKSA